MWDRARYGTHESHILSNITEVLRPECYFTLSGRKITFLLSGGCYTARSHTPQRSTSLECTHTSGGRWQWILLTHTPTHTHTHTHTHTLTFSQNWSLYTVKYKIASQLVFKRNLVTKNNLNYGLQGVSWRSIHLLVCSWENSHRTG